MNEQLSFEINANYDFFARNLGNFLAEHSGQYALLKNRHVVGFFDEPGSAYRHGKENFSDGLFSIQEVTEEPVDLGFFSHVSN